LEDPGPRRHLKIEPITQRDERSAEAQVLYDAHCTKSFKSRALGIRRYLRRTRK